MFFHFYNCKLNPQGFLCFLFFSRFLTLSLLDFPLFFQVLILAAFILPVYVFLR